jgi:ElaB/YqjD/DUF883 family membrane-anchored ribosome-binding protein
MESIENVDRSSFDERNWKEKSGLDLKETVADKLKAAARSLRTKAQQFGSDRPNTVKYGQQAADWLEDTSNYVRQFDGKRFKEDIEDNVRKNPGRTLLIAGAVGLVLGTLIRRR